MIIFLYYKKNIYNYKDIKKDTRGNNSKKFFGGRKVNKFNTLAKENTVAQRPWTTARLKCLVVMMGWKLRKKTGWQVIKEWCWALLWKERRNEERM